MTDGQVEKYAVVMHADTDEERGGSLLCIYGHWQQSWATVLWGDRDKETDMVVKTNEHKQMEVG